MIFSINLPYIFADAFSNPISILFDYVLYTVMDKETNQGMTPEKCASLIIEYGLNEESDVVLCPTIPKIAIFLRYNFPAIYFWIMRNRAKSSGKS